MTIQSMYDPGFRCKKDAVFSGLSRPGAGVLFSEVAGHLGDAAFLERTAECRAPRRIGRMGWFQQRKMGSVSL